MRQPWPELLNRFAVSQNLISYLRTANVWQNLSSPFKLSSILNPLVGYFCHRL